jgi:calcium/calmodulin-dependent protein kinase I
MSVAHTLIVEYWQNVSATAKDFVRMCLTINQKDRPTAKQALNHKWLSDDKPHFVEGADGGPKDLLPGIKEGFNAKKTCEFLSVVVGRRDG